MLRVLDRVVEHFGIDRPGAIGGRWAEDVSVTAWDLLVRHEDIERRQHRLAVWAASAHT